MTMIATQPRLLQAADAGAIRALVNADPVLHCVLDARLHVAPDLNPHRLGGFLWGLSDQGPAAAEPVTGPARLRAAAFHGGNLIPVGDDLAALEAIANQLGKGGRGCSSIVGAVAAVEAIWPVLHRRWGRARAVRRRQPLLSTDAIGPVRPDPLVRQVRPDELDQFLPAAVAMFTEELEVSPIGQDAGMAYRRRLADLIGAGRALARFDERGRVEFKAEIGVLSPYTAQVQGVWVRPDLRGAGLGTAAMASVLQAALALAPTVSLYVNDFNTVGRRMYQRLGMRQLATLQTVLF